MTEKNDPEPVQTPLGLRYPCPECGTYHEFMTTAILCQESHETRD